MSNMEYIDMILPKECESFALSCVTFDQREVIDLSKMKCKRMVLEDVDLSAVKSIILPKGLDEVKFKYGIKFPENIDFNDAKNIVFTKSAKPDFSKTQRISASKDAKIEISNRVDNVLFKKKQLNAMKTSNFSQSYTNTREQIFAHKGPLSPEILFRYREIMQNK